MEEAVPTGERSDGAGGPTAKGGQATQAARVGQAFSPGPDVDEVSLVLSPGARWVTETYPTREVQELAGGRVRVVLAVGGLAWLERLLLRLGPDAEAVDPPHLEVARRRAAAQVLARYSD